jgi:hypothetical protein
VSSAYDKYHVMQLDGSDHQGRNCTVASLATQIRILTRNELQPRPERLRLLIHDHKSEGLDLVQAAEAYNDFTTPRWEEDWLKRPPFRYRYNHLIRDFQEKLDLGFTALVAVRYGAVPHPYRRRLSTFQGGHAMVVIQRKRNKDGVAGYLVSDPLKGSPIFYPEDVLHKASFAWSWKGVIDAGYLPRGTIRPGWKPIVDEEPEVPEPEGPVDEQPVPVPVPEPVPVDVATDLGNELEATKDRVAALVANRDQWYTYATLQNVKFKEGLALPSPVVLD